MDILTQLLNAITGSIFILTGVADPIVDRIRDFIGPIYLLVVSIVAIIFLLKRQTSALIQFMVIAIIVGVLLFTPEVIQNLATLISSLFTGQ